MKIDASKVTCDDIEKYEKLMLGAVTLASSNSNHKVGNASDTNTEVFAKHTWTRDTSKSQNLGNFEMKFEKPTSLVSLNMDFAFTCALSAIKGDLESVEQVQVQQEVA